MQIAHGLDADAYTVLALYNLWSLYGRKLGRIPNSLLWDKGEYCLSIYTGIIYELYGG
jgi:hypothetical protein